jgi:hypothetical protein
MTWPCEAYGVPGLEVGALCFIADQVGERRCAGRPACHAIMSAARKKTFARIQERAAAGDETSAYLAGEFPSPNDIFGGGEPLGLWCPQCGEPPTVILAPGSSVFCGNTACRILMWDPTMSYAQMLEEGIREVDL